LCRSRRELSNAYLLAKIGVDTAENEPLEVWGENSIQYSLHSLLVWRQARRQAARQATRHACQQAWQQASQQASQHAWQQAWQQAWQRELHQVFAAN